MRLLATSGGSWMVLRGKAVTGRRVLRLVSGRAGAPLPWIPDQVRNDGWWRAAGGGWRRRLGGSRAAPLGCGSSPATRGVKCGRRGAVRAATANHRLRFLGFARNDRGALWWNDREGNCGGMTLGRYGWRASGPVLARDAREVLRCAQNDKKGAQNDVGELTMIVGS